MTSSLLSNVAAWLATYLIHSTILLVGAVLVSRIATLRPRVQDALWKVALVGGLATATGQITLGVTPFAGRLAVGPTAGAAASSALAHSSVTLETPTSSARAPQPRNKAPRPQLADSPAIVPAQPTSAESVRSPIDSPATMSMIALIVVGIWGALAAALLLMTLAGAYRIARSIGTRRILTNSSANDTLQRLCTRAGYDGVVHLSASHTLEVPVAFGVTRREICVPERALRELNDHQLESMLAHELAHIAYRDPLWRLVSTAIARALFVQPLNHIATRKLAACSELLADDWAVQHTGRPLALARCLTVVAGWTQGRPLPRTVAAMAVTGSGLGHRVRRLIAGTPHSNRVGRWLAPVAAAALGTIAWTAPGARAAVVSNTAAPPPLALPTVVAATNRSTPSTPRVSPPVPTPQPATPATPPAAATPPTPPVPARPKRHTDRVRDLLSLASPNAIKWFNVAEALIGADELEQFLDDLDELTSHTPDLAALAQELETLLADVLKHGGSFDVDIDIDIPDISLPDIDIQIPPKPAKPPKRTHRKASPHHDRARDRAARAHQRHLRNHKKALKRAKRARKQALQYAQRTRDRMRRARRLSRPQRALHEALRREQQRHRREIERLLRQHRAQP